jgi:hypothetical protein
MGHGLSSALEPACWQPSEPPASTAEAEGICRAGFFEPSKPKKKNGKGKKNGGQDGAAGEAGEGTVLAPAYEAAVNSDLVASFALANKEGNEVAEADQVGCKAASTWQPEAH